MCFLAGAWPDHLVTTLQINKNIKVERDSLGTFRISKIFCELFASARAESVRSSRRQTLVKDFGENRKVSVAAAPPTLRPKRKHMPSG